MSNYIASERVRLGLSQERLAEALNVSRGTVKCWETERQQPTEFNVKKMLNLFGCTEDYLLGKTNERLNNSLTVIVGSEAGDKDA